MNKKEREACVKKIGKREKKCPFNPVLACEDCRLFIQISKELGQVCSINFLAMRSD